jgi:predicted Zn-dependent protease
MMKKLILALMIGLTGISACSVSPVTGKRHFQVYGDEWEQQVGAQMYAPMKQSQGGEFILDPELTEYVQHVGRQLAERARRKDQLDFEFTILNDSTPNAWALPGGKIAINRGLLTELDSEAELAAVLGHEVVHSDAAHGARAQSKGMLTQIGAVVSMVILGSVDSQAAREVAMMVPAVGAQLLTQKYSRDAEREADEYGMLYMSEAGYNPLGAVELQETFVEISEGRNEDWMSGLFASHPPSRERLERNQKMASELSEEGSFGRARYAEKTQFLRRVQPAYDAFDEANKAVSDDELERAQGKLNEAMAIEPRESLFHSLQGDIYALQKKPKQALASYQKAINTNPGFFYAYLRKGQVEYKRDKLQAARSDLSTSVTLMPTAEAHYLLGEMDKDEGKLDSANDHFRIAAQSNSESGQKASRELLIQDLANNPARYIGSRAEVDANNMIWIRFGNLTQVPMKNIEISYAWLDERGQTRQRKISYRGPLKSGEQDRVKTGIRLENASDLERRIRVQITAASVAES